MISDEHMKAVKESIFSIFGDREALEIMGGRLRAYRLMRNWTQEHIASLAGVSIPTYGRIERGDPSVAVGHVVKVAALLGFSQAFEDVIPEPSPKTIAVEEHLRKRAYRRRNHAATNKA
jgi:transcriptional regulator with XRE-family HTH domain